MRESKRTSTKNKRCLVSARPRRTSFDMQSHHALKAASSTLCCGDGRVKWSSSRSLARDWSLQVQSSASAIVCATLADQQSAGCYHKCIPRESVKHMDERSGIHEAFCLPLPGHEHSLVVAPSIARGVSSRAARAPVAQPSLVLSALPQHARCLLHCTQQPARLGHQCHLRMLGHLDCG